MTAWKILRALKENPYITAEQIAEIIGVSKPTVERELKSMKQNNIIKRVGSPKTGNWEIIKNTEK